MATTVIEKVDYRLLGKMSKLVICSSCLQSGKVTPVPQIITEQRPLTNKCGECRIQQSGEGLRRRFGKLLKFPR
jgi:hypothetical protein